LAREQRVGQQVEAFALLEASLEEGLGVLGIQGWGDSSFNSKLL
jgi:hypothetical protein